RRSIEVSFFFSSNRTQRFATTPVPSGARSNHVRNGLLVPKEFHALLDIARSGCRSTHLCLRTELQSAYLTEAADFDLGRCLRTRFECKEDSLWSHASRSLARYSALSSYRCRGPLPQGSLCRLQRPRRR